MDSKSLQVWTLFLYIFFIFYISYAAQGVFGSYSITQPIQLVPILVRLNRVTYKKNKNNM